MVSEGERKREVWAVGAFVNGTTIYGLFNWINLLFRGTDCVDCRGIGQLLSSSQAGRCSVIYLLDSL